MNKCEIYDLLRKIQRQIIAGFVELDDKIELEDYINYVFSNYCMEVIYDQGENDK